MYLPSMVNIKKGIELFLKSQIEIVVIIFLIIASDIFKIKY